MRVTIDASEVHAFAGDLRAAGSKVEALAPLAVSKVGHDMSAQTQVNIIAEGAVDTGNLLNSVSLDLGETGMGFELGPTAEYGGYVEQGVDHPFTIHARPGGFLRFVVDGRVVFARQVTHPASPPRPYLGPAFDQHMPNLEKALGAIGVRAVSGA